MAVAGELRKLTLSILAPASGSDTRLVPAENSLCYIRRQGASAAETKTILTSATTLAVRDPGALRVGEVCFLGTSFTSTFLIDSIDSRSQITLHSTTGASIDVTSGDRISPVVLPTLYSDAIGAATTTNPVTVPATGAVAVYLRENPIDYLVTGGLVTTTLFTDAEAGAVGNLLNVLNWGLKGDGSSDDEPALNRLIDDIWHSGGGAFGRLYFPRGTYMIRSKIRLDGENVTAAIDGLKVFGDPGAIIKIDSSNWDGSQQMMSLERAGTSKSNIIVEGLTFDGSSVGAAAGTAVTGLWIRDVTDYKVLDCVFKNIGDPAAGITPPNDGIRLGGLDFGGGGTTTQAARGEIRGCKFDTIERNGISGINVAGLLIHDNFFNSFENAAIDIEPNSASPTVEQIIGLNIHHNDIVNARTLGIFVGPNSGIAGAVYAGDMEGAQVSFNNIRGANAGRGIVFHNMLNSQMLFNTYEGAAASSPDNDLFLMSSCQECIAFGNTIGGASASVSSVGALTLDSARTVQSRNNIAACNIVPGTSYIGLKAVDQEGPVVLANILAQGSDAAKDGIRLDRSGSFNSRRHAVLGNVISGNAGKGLHVLSSSVNLPTFIGNVIVNNTTQNVDDNSGEDTIYCGNQIGDTTKHLLTAFNTADRPGGGGSDSWTGEFTLATGTATSTVVTNGNVTTSSIIQFTAKSAAAGAAVGGATGVYISAVSAGSFTASHASGMSGATFQYEVKDRSSVP